MSKRWTEQDVLKIMQIIRTVNAVSLSSPITNSPEQLDTEIGDFIVDPGPGPQELTEEKDKNKLLNEVVTKLGPREQQVITLRYGLSDGIFRTLDDVAEIYNVSRQRIEQIEKKALRKMKWIIQVKYRLKREDL